MKIILRADRLTLENNNAVMRLNPELENPRSGDVVSGELFLTTIDENMVINKGGVIEIDFSDEPEEQPVE